MDAPIYRFAIQIISYNRPHYLDQTLESLMRVIDSKKDKIAVIEQSDKIEDQKKAIEICKKYNNVQVYPVVKNLGQRGATNYLYYTGFFNDSKYCMISDHDNLFHENISIYGHMLDDNPNIWIASGYHSPEHDIENKLGDWILKTTARAGHMVMRTIDFLSLFPIDEKYGKSAWYCGLDWWLTHWGKTAPGRNKKEFIACYPGGVEHIGRESTWQGKYDDEYSLEDLKLQRSMNLYDLVKLYPPRHTYISDKYWYEKLSDDDFYNEYGNSTDKSHITIIDSNEISTYPKLDSHLNILAFNYIWPKYSTSFLVKSITQALTLADKYFIIINEKSYIGNPASIKRIDKILKQLEQFGDKVIVVINKSDAPERCKQNNIAYHFEKIAQAYQNDINYLWMVQSDEVYDTIQIDMLKANLDKSNFKGAACIMNPICYIDTPNWAVDPKEDFRRLTFIDIKLFKSVDFNYDRLKLQKTDVDFHHLSYVMPSFEIDEKLNNWGHRNDVNNVKGLFINKLKRLKTNKTLTDLHPVIPSTYPKTVYRDDAINNSLFLEYFNDLLNEPNHPYTMISKLFNNVTDDISTDNPIQYMSMSEYDRRVLSTILTQLLPDVPKILVFKENNGLIGTLFKLLTNGNIISLSSFQPGDILGNLSNSQIQSCYKSGITRSYNFDFKFTSADYNIPTLDYKVISSLNNNHFDMVFLNTMNDDVLEKSFVEAWPKVKNHGWFCGTFASSIGINSKLLSLLTSHKHKCPWGETQFDYYEYYYDLSKSLQFANTQAEQKSIGIWLARVKK